MTRKAAILGLGQSGGAWAHRFHAAGWNVAGFDPEPLAEGTPNFQHDWRRETTISAAVHGADWVVICVPERLELLRKVIQRAQAEAPKDAIIAVAARIFDIEDIQGCAVRPNCVIRVNTGETGGFIVDLTSKTDDAARTGASNVLAALAASDGIAGTATVTDNQTPDAESA
ncbi:MAG: 3-hydroxyacyl-CoA dehydrogenase NAD-binding domain-containing protein [Boseongicola sp.]